MIMEMFESLLHQVRQPLMVVVTGMYNHQTETVIQMYTPVAE